MILKLINFSSSNSLKTPLMFSKDFYRDIYDVQSFHDIVTVNLGLISRKQMPGGHMKDSLCTLIKGSKNRLSNLHSEELDGKRYDIGMFAPPNREDQFSFHAIELAYFLKNTFPFSDDSFYHQLSNYFNLNSIAYYLQLNGDVIAFNITPHFSSKVCWIAIFLPDPRLVSQKQLLTLKNLVFELPSYTEFYLLYNFKTDGDGFFTNDAWEKVCADDVEEFLDAYYSL